MRLAAIVYREDDAPNAVLMACATVWRAQGLPLAGLVQRRGAVLGSGKRSMLLECLASGETFSILQDLGSGSDACCLDVDALARAAGAVRRALATTVGLAVFNKFGEQEIAGRGLRAELADAVCRGIPTVVAVPQRLQADWTAFCGGDYVPQPCESAPILAWAEGATRSSSV